MNSKSRRATVRPKEASVKAHDCHVIMTQLLPVALRGILPLKGPRPSHKALLVLQHDLKKGH